MHPFRPMFQSLWILAKCQAQLSGSKANNGPAAVMVMGVRGISSTSPAGRRMHNCMKDHWLDTSRNVAKEEESTVEKVALSKDGRVILCWHPPTPFPYEMSKPIPLDVVPTDSNLKVQALLPVREAFRRKNDRLVVQELMQLTYTPKYQWFSKKRRREKYKDLDVLGLNEKRDRDYL